MAPPVTKELSITYGATTVGGTQDNQIDGKVLIDRQYQTCTVSFQVAITATASAAAFATACTSFESAFTTPEQDLTITLDGQTLLSFSASSNTGWDCQPQVQKLGDDMDSGRSRLYLVTLVFELPADRTSDNGLIDEREAVSINPAGVRTLTISGRFTALSGNDARAQYAAQIGTYATAAQGRVDGSATWELIQEDTEGDNLDKQLTFVRVYRELKENQSSGTLDDADVFNQTLIISVGRQAPGDSNQNTVRLAVVNVTWSAWIGGSTDLKTKYENDIIPYLADRAAAKVDGGLRALVGETVDFDEQTRTVSSQTSWWFAESAGFLSSTATEEIVTPDEVIRVPVWSGQPNVDRETYPNIEPVSKSEIIDELFLEAGGVEPNPTPVDLGASTQTFNEPRAGGLSGASVDSAGFTLVRSVGRRTRFYVGIPKYGYTFRMRQRQIERAYVFVRDL